MTTKTKRTYGYRLYKERWADCDSVTVKVLAREGDNESPVNPRSEGEDCIWDAPKFADGLMYDGLTVRIYLGDYGPMKFSAQFEGVHSVDHRKCARMAKTFKRLGAALEKSDYPQEVGDYVEVVAKALGLTWYAKEVRPMNRWNYASGEWAWLPIRALKDELRAEWRAMADKFAREHPEKAEAA